LAIFYLPFTIDRQLKAIQDLLKIRFLKNQEEKELKRIETDLKFKIPLNLIQKEFLKTVIAKYGSYVKS